jgi:hypothetical protein
MNVLRHLIVCALLIVLAAPSARAQSNRLRIAYPDVDSAVFPARSSAAASLHPAAKGALVGAAAGAGSWGAVGLWYCTVGPNEVGECRNSGMWTRGFLMWSAVGAGIGALIGALR